MVVNAGSEPLIFGRGAAHRPDLSCIRRSEHSPNGLVLRLLCPFEDQSKLSERLLHPRRALSCKFRNRRTGDLDVGAGVVVGVAGLGKPVLWVGLDAHPVVTVWQAVDLDPLLGKPCAVLVSPTHADTGLDVQRGPCPTASVLLGLGSVGK